MSTTPTEEREAIKTKIIEAAHDKYGGYMNGSNKWAIIMEAMEQYALLAASPIKEDSEAERTYYEKLRELACDFAAENLNALVENLGYQNVLKQFDQWFSENTYHKNKFLEGQENPQP